MTDTTTDYPPPRQSDTLLARCIVRDLWAALPDLPRRQRVYFILDATNCAVKIGTTARDPRQRLEDLQIGHPGNLRLIGFTDGGTRRERGMHHRYSHLRIRGEWFRCEGELATFLLDEVLPDNGASMPPRKTGTGTGSREDVVRLARAAKEGAERGNLVHALELAERLLQ